MHAFVGLFAGPAIEDAELVASSAMPRLVAIVAAGIAEELATQPRARSGALAVLRRAKAEAIAHIVGDAEAAADGVAPEHRDRVRRGLALVREGVELLLDARLADRRTQ